MRYAAKFSVLAIAVALTGTLVTSAMAESQWERTHPRRDQVNDRLENQNRRIRQERREGELTGGQAARLHREDRTIRREERAMARFNHGRISPAEQRSLDQQENAVSGQIGR